MSENKVKNQSQEFRYIHKTEDESKASYDILIENRQIFEADASADKLDYQIAAFSGTLTATFDIFWVGDFSLSDAQSWGRKKVSDFVLKVSQSKGYKGTELDGAIKYLEKSYKIPSDRLTNEFGGGLQHHLRDFVHHPTIVGLIMSILSQFTGKGYGTDTDGNFIIKDFPNDELIGSTFKEKIFNGTVIWAFHLVSDMAGSSLSAGKGTGIPGPILSFFKEISALPVVKDITVKYLEDDIKFSALISKIFNSTYFKGVRVDLRTELGVANELSRQALPVLLNDCIVKAFYFVRRLCIEVQEKDVHSLADLKKLNAKNFIPANSRALARMLTISSITFNVVEKSAAFTKATIKNKGIKDNFVKDFLLNINFIGVAHFAVTFKHDAKFIYEDIKGLFQIKVDKVIDDYQREVLIPSVEIETRIDNRNLYFYTFDQLLKKVVRSRDALSSPLHASIRENMGQFYDIGGSDFRIYKSIVSTNENRAVSATSKLLIKMFEQNGIHYEMYPVEPMFSRMLPEEQMFILDKNGKRIGCSVTSKTRSFSPDKIERLKEYGIDAVKFIRLNNPKGDIAIRAFEQEMESAAKQSDGFIQMTLIKDFFDTYFGPDEFSVFMEYVTDFNERARTCVGFNTVIAPSDDSIAKFKKSKSKMLQSYDYLKKLPGDINKDQANILYDNYIKRGLYRAMTGSCNFADSFVSSEWYYSINRVTNSLDQTAVVTGYLKSVEQLLYSIVRLSIDSGNTIKRKGANDLMDFTTANEDLIDTSLGSLIRFAKHYGGIFAVNSYVKRHIVDTLIDWRVNYRNDHLHKDNLYDSKEIDAIRVKAIYLYFLLLGGCKIDESDFDAFGVVSLEAEANIHMRQFAFSQKRFEKWINPILNYGLPKDAKGIIFNIYERDFFDKEDYGWDLQLIATSSYTEEDYNWTLDEMSPLGHDMFCWKAQYSEAEALSEAVNAVKEYIINGQFSEELKRYSAVVVSYISYHKDFWGEHNEVVYRKD
ncbi:hypothetical protein [Neobacillus drentensis]|uniref:hypothetical protein n=1 Tax=Neobacillus drentensis TaxID=220684 RepID=UPI002FFE0370